MSHDRNTKDIDITIGIIFLYIIIKVSLIILCTLFDAQLLVKLVTVLYGLLILRHYLKKLGK